MKKIVMRMEPFVRNQKLTVIENGNHIDYISIPTDEIVSGVQSLMNKYNDIEEFAIAGSKQYSKKIKRDLASKTEFAKLTVTLL